MGLLDSRFSGMTISYRAAQVIERFCLRYKFLLALILTLSLISACNTKTSKKKIKIGLSLDTLRVEHRQRGRDLFVAKAEELGASVLVQSADSNDALQNSQATNLLTQGIDVLVVLPYKEQSAGAIVEAAHKVSLPVVAYERLIPDSALDLYISFDDIRIGELQAEYLVKHRSNGNYVLIGGSPTDNNALLLRKGQMKILKPYVEKGQISIVANRWAVDWQPEEALRIMQNALTENGNKIDAVLASNDALAGAAIQALAKQNLAGKVLVSGQDADLAACQRVAAGTQSMTVYKPVYALPHKAAQAAIRLASKEPLYEKTYLINNGKKDIHAILIDPILVDKNNLVSTVIADGYQKLEQIYQHLPADQWPKK